MKTFLKIFLLVFLIALGVGALGSYWTFYRTLPNYESTLSLEGLDNEVRVYWDTFGIPHIYAENKNDLYTALGYVHAQDRLWQMTLTQMASEGRLAEFLGRDLVEADIFQRTLGFWETARSIEAQLADSTRQILQAYANGVNAFTQAHPKDLPLEFSLVDMEPIEWTVTHSLALSRMMAWELNIAWKNELSLAYLAEQLTPAEMQELLPATAALGNLNKPEIPSRFLGETLPRLLNRQRTLSRILGTEGYGAGSNAWAVSADKSDSQAPLLAGDPHLGLSMPGKWYEVHLSLNGENISGATIAGAPIVVLGQNDHLGWSLTNMMTDDTDFFIEAVNPDNPSQYVADSLEGAPVFEEFVLQEELIKVKGYNDTTFTRMLSRHGPVISEIYPDQAVIGDRVLSMRWTGHDISNEVDALLGINWSGSFEEFQSHLTEFKSPGQNVVYADRDGNIALFSMGNVPVRSGPPLFFREGWDPDRDWQGYVPFEALPRIVNPESGWVANANNPVDPGSPYYISIYWEPDSRYDRITQYLTQNDELSSEAFQAMQLDTYSHYAREVTEMILPVLEASDEDFSMVISYLENWDYRYETSETAASIMDGFILALADNTFRDEMGDEVYSNFISYSGLPVRILHRFLRENSSFFDNRETENIETRSQLVIRSMEDAVDSLRLQFGDEPFEWRWENVHHLTLKPQLFGEAAESPDADAALRLIVNNLMNQGPYPARGHKMSINKGEYLWSDPYRVVVGPSIRRIVDLSDLGKTLSITPTGQSGNFLSQYYGDQTESWMNGQYKFIYQDSTFFDETVYRTMRLLPAN